MAKVLKNIFNAGTDEIKQSFTIESWHVSQSVDALTGVQDYDIIISGSLTLTGSTNITGSTVINGGVTINGSPTVNGTLTVTQGITGSLHGTASWAQNASQAISASYASSSTEATNAQFVQVTSFNGDSQYPIILASNFGANQSLYGDGDSALLYNPRTNTLFNSGAVILTGSISMSNGLLYGTSSWANNAISTSYAQTASYINPLSQSVHITISSGGLFRLDSWDNRPFNYFFNQTGSSWISGSQRMFGNSTTQGQTYLGAHSNFIKDPNVLALPWYQQKATLTGSNSIINTGNPLTDPWRLWLARTWNSSSAGQTYPYSPLYNSVYITMLDPSVAAPYSTSARGFIIHQSQSTDSPNDRVVIKILPSSNSSYASQVHFSNNWGDETAVPNSIKYNDISAKKITFDFPTGALSPAGIWVYGYVSASQGFTGSLLGTASWATNSISSSLASRNLLTASVNLNTITFTKGDGSTFPITVDTGSGVGNVGTLQQVTTQGASTTIPITASIISASSFTGSLLGTASWAVTASHALNAASDGDMLFITASTFTTQSKNYFYFTGSVGGFDIGSTNGTNPSSTGDISFNSATKSSVTQIKIASTDENGTNMNDWVSAINKGSKLYFSHPNSGQGWYTVISNDGGSLGPPAFYTFSVLYVSESGLSTWSVTDTDFTYVYANNPLNTTLTTGYTQLTFSGSQNIQNSDYNFGGYLTVRLHPNINNKPGDITILEYSNTSEADVRIDLQYAARSGSEAQSNYSYASNSSPVGTYIPDSSGTPPLLISSSERGTISLMTIKYASGSTNQLGFMKLGFENVKLT